jgi:two-component system, cell cycle sensor histidine kinase and response regulator CckA
MTHDAHTTAPDAHTTAHDAHTTAPDAHTTAPDAHTTAHDAHTTAPDCRQHPAVIAKAFALLIDDHPVPMWMYDLTTLSFLEVNRAAVKKYGYSLDEFRTMTLKDIRPAEDVAHFLDDITHRDTSASRTLATRHLLRSGSIIDVEITSHVVEYADCRASLVIAYDVTEQKLAEAAKKRSEEEYKNLFEHASDAIVIFEPDQEIILQANKEACALYGYSPDELIGMSLKKLTKDIPRGEEQISHLLRDGVYVSFETVHLNRQGQEISILLNSSVIDYGGRKAILSMNRDMTERKKSEQLLREVQRRESIGVLSSGIAHDFNNLLGAMMGNVTIAQTRIPPDHPAIQNLEKAILAMDRAAELTKQILAYSGKGQYEVRTFDLGDLLRAHIGLFEVSLSKNVKLVTHLSPTPVYIKADARQIEQVVMNLVANGGDAIEDKPGTVTITLSTVSLSAEELLPYGVFTTTKLKEGSYALVHVSDDGIGMTMETQKIVFDPFFTTKFIGRGLGLSAVLGILRGHDGGIAIDSTIGEGTTFSVILPLDTAPPSVNDAKNAEPNEAKELQNTILVIDDEYEIATVAQEMLETAQYNVLIELNPLQGIEVFTRHKAEIGLVLLDMAMPEMSGKVVVERLQAIDPSIPIIISSGYSEDESMEKIGKAKVSGFIQKPYRLQALLTLVDTVIHHSR